MRIAKLIDPLHNNNSGSIKNYFLVPDNYDFVANLSIDVTSISALEVFVDRKEIEYGVFRDTINNIYVPNWATTSFSDKKLCVKHYKYPSSISQTEFDTYYTLSEHENNWNLIVSRSRDYRMDRLYALFAKITYRCTSNQVVVIYLSTKAYCFDYYYANLPHLLLWISNGSYPALGIDFTTNGFAQSSGYTVDIKNELLDIILNGNYKYKK
jgi:hypothetical protein